MERVCYWERAYPTQKENVIQQEDGKGNFLSLKKLTQLGLSSTTGGIH